jgi:hypothetical protein
MFLRFRKYQNYLWFPTFLNFPPYLYCHSNRRFR